MRYVYILYSPVVDRYFVGSAPDLEKAVERHNSGKNRHTKTGIPWNPVYQKKFESRREADDFEKRVKSSSSREELVSFIRED